jgi:hypothetical protein
MAAIEMSLYFSITKRDGCAFHKELKISQNAPALLEEVLFLG